MSAQEVKENVHRLHKNMGSSPLIMFLLAACVFTLWLAASIVQIQTSEYLALGNSTRVAGVSWSVLQQPWLLLSGQAPIALATSWLYGWIVEIVTLIFALALSVSIVKIGSVNKLLSKVFVATGAVLIFLNSWADYSSSPGANPLVQVLIALAIGIMVTCGLPLAVGLGEHAIEEF